MTEFRIDIRVSITDHRDAARNPNAEGLLALRAIVVEAPDEVSAELRAAQITAALVGRG